MTQRHRPTAASRRRPDVEHVPAPGAASVAAGDNLPADFQYPRGSRPRRSPRSKAWDAYFDCLSAFIFIGVVVLIVMLVWEVFIPTHKQRMYVAVLSFSLIPIGLAIYTIVRPASKPIHQRIMPLVLVSAFASGFLPRWWNSLVAAMAMSFFLWLTRPLTTTTVGGGAAKKDSNRNLKDSDQETDSAQQLLSKTTQSSTNNNSIQNNISNKDRNLMKAGFSAALIILIIIIENFLIWVVSATFEPGWNPVTAPEPLQDNGRLVMQAAFKALDFTKRDVVSLRRVWNVQWILVACLGAALGTVEFHPTRQLGTFATRACLTFAAARFLRTVSFVLTVLPSQNKWCYDQHFPNPPPDSWKDWILEGLKPNSHGGCNDLIVSGHATATATMACIAISFGEDHLFSFAIWWLMAMDYAVEVYEGFHYSVDMWMGAVLISMLWRILKTIEDNNTDRNEATLQDMMQRLRTERLTFKVALDYIAPPLISFLQATILPEATANIVLVGFTSFGVIQILVNGVQHHTRLIFFCVLYISIVVYL